MIKAELFASRSVGKKLQIRAANLEAEVIEKAIEECKINCPVNGEVVLISDLKKYADNLRGE